MTPSPLKSDDVICGRPLSGIQRSKWILKILTFRHYPLINLPLFWWKHIIFKHQTWICIQNFLINADLDSKYFKMYSGKTQFFFSSGAPLPPDLQNWTKSHSFHDSGLSGQLKFCWASWKSLWLNYSNEKRPGRIFYLVPPHLFCPAQLLEKLKYLPSLSMENKVLSAGFDKTFPSFWLT